MAANTHSSFRSAFLRLRRGLRRLSTGTVRLAKRSAASLRVSDSTVFLVGVVGGAVATSVTLAITISHGYTTFEVVIETLSVSILSGIVLLLFEQRRKSDYMVGLVAALDELFISEQSLSLFRQLASALAEVLRKYSWQDEVGVAWRRSLTRCISELQQLATGTLLVPSDDLSYKRELLDSIAGRGLKKKTTSLTREDLSLWQSEEGQDYWKDEYAAIMSSELEVQRIFIIERSTPELEHLIQQHAHATVDVFRVNESSLPKADQVDITLWGDELVFYQRVHTEHGVQYDQFTVEEKTVALAKKQYHRILGLARARCYNLQPTVNWEVVSHGYGALLMRTGRHERPTEPPRPGQE